MTQTLQTVITAASTTVVILGLAIPFHYDRISGIRADYDARTEILEREKADTAAERDRYYEYLRDMPGTIPLLEYRIDEVKQENERLQKELNLRNTIPVDTVYPRNISKGEAYIDQTTGLILGLLSVDRKTFDGEFTANIALTLPDQNEEKISDLSVGWSKVFVHANRSFRLTVTEVNWFNTSIEIFLAEIED